jgi:hypothetical protein
LACVRALFASGSPHRGFLFIFPVAAAESGEQTQFAVTHVSHFALMRRFAPLNN